jgi:hypothetical protein
LVCRYSIPPNRFAVTLIHTFALTKHESHVVLCKRKSFVRSHATLVSAIITHDSLVKLSSHVE